MTYARALRTGFSSVNASTAAASGGSSTVGVGVYAGGVGANAGVATGPGFVAAPATPEFQGNLVTDVTHVDRSAQDATEPASPTQASDAANADAAMPVEIGFSPATQADLGRGGGLAGPATNVFRRSYRLVTSTDLLACAPDVNAASAGEGKCAAAATTKPAPPR